MTNYVVVKIGYMGRKHSFEKKFILKGKRSIIEDSNGAVFIKYPNVVKENKSEMIWYPSHLEGFRAYAVSGISSFSPYTASIEHTTSKKVAELLFEID